MTLSTRSRAALILIMLLGGSMLIGERSPTGAQAPHGVVVRDFHYGHAFLRAVVDLRRLHALTPRGHHGARALRSAPFAREDMPGARSGARGEHAQALPAAASDSIPAPGVKHAFAAMTYDQENQGVVPPDPQVAVGPNGLLEAVNDTWSVWSKSGSLEASGDLTDFFHLGTTYYPSDPWVAYDSTSGRWFLSITAFTFNGGSQILIATSDTGDPAGTWHVYTVTSQPAVVMDQPKISVSADKVVMSWTDAVGVSPDSDYDVIVTGAELWVLEKADLVAGASSLRDASFGTTKSYCCGIPAQPLSSSSDEYLLYEQNPFDDGTTPNSLNVIKISGTPAAGNVQQATLSLQIRTTTMPPLAVQPGGALGIETNDSRLISAVWQNNTLWSAANDACVAPGATATRACLRLFQLSTSGGSVALKQDFDVAAPNVDLYYPAVTLDAAGDMFAVFTESSSTLPASVAVVGQPAGAPLDAVSHPVIVERGTGSYVNCGGDCSDANPNRWGDYSGAAPDPVDPATVWVDGEYAPGGGSDNWGTAIGSLTYSGLEPPTATATVPPSPTSTTAPVSKPTQVPRATATTPPPSPTATKQVRVPLRLLLSLHKPSVRAGGHDRITVHVSVHARYAVRMIAHFPHAALTVSGHTSAGGLWQHRFRVPKLRPRQAATVVTIAVTVSGHGERAQASIGLKVER